MGAFSILLETDYEDCRRTRASICFSSFPR